MKEWTGQRVVWLLQGRRAVGLEKAEKEAREHADMEQRESKKNALIMPSYNMKSTMSR